MFGKLLRYGALALGVMAFMPLAATANEVTSATVNPTCSGYTFQAQGQYLQPGDKYEVNYWFGLQFPNNNVWDVNGSLPVQQDQNGNFNNNLYEGWGPMPKGNYSFTYGHATLYDITTNQQWNTVYINFSPACFTCQGTCATQSQNNSNFNGTAINPGSYIWFNSNFQGQNIPKTGATLYFTNQTITFTAGGTPYTLPVPNAEVEFSPNATCTSTTYDSQTNTWFTTAPLSGEDETFLSGLSYPVPAGFGQVTGNVTWNGTFQTSNSGIGAQWKWGAAVYSQFTQSYNDLAVKAGHQTSCQIKNGDHAGTPEGNNANGTPWKNFVIGGARGGGGSNFTGSWSGTVNTTVKCTNKAKK